MRREGGEKCLLGNVKGRVHLGDLGEEGRIILKCNIMK
jgi:hypothetical protein